MRHSKRDWLSHGHNKSWKPPAPATRWKRLPIIRHIRGAWLSMKIEQHYSILVCRLGLVRTGYDEWVLYGIFRGWL